MQHQGPIRPGLHELRLGQQLREEEDSLNFTLENLGLVCILLLPQPCDFQQLTSLSQLFHLQNEETDHDLTGLM